VAQAKVVLNANWMLENNSSTIGSHLVRVTKKVMIQMIVDGDYIDYLSQHTIIIKNIARD